MARRFAGAQSLNEGMQKSDLHGLECVAEACVYDAEAFDES